MVQRRKKCCTPTTEDSHHVLCVFSVLASAGVLAEGIRWLFCGQGFKSYSWRLLNTPGCSGLGRKGRWFRAAPCVPIILPFLLVWLYSQGSFHRHLWRLLSSHSKHFPEGFEGFFWRCARISRVTQVDVNEEKFSDLRSEASPSCAKGLYAGILAGILLSWLTVTKVFCGDEEYSYGRLCA